jgi:hypothetical protein
VSLDNPNGIESAASKNSKQRRTFLKRASAGAVIASIPGRSAWANIRGSIIASGHGSDMNAGRATALRSQGYWKNHGFGNVSSAQTFAGAFGFGNNAFKVKDNGSVGTFNSDNSLINILNGLKPNGDRKNSWKGPNDINVQMIAMYINAANHNGSEGVFYPALDMHGSIEAFGLWLYNSAKDDAFGIGTFLKNTIEENHV